jgi:hypothetical protein
VAHKQRARQLGADRAGLDDFAGGDKSGLSLPSNLSLKQAAARRLRRQRAVERLHELGPRALGEFLSELARRNPGMAGDLSELLEAYTARLTPSLLRAVGGDQFPASPMRVIGGDR